jgi:hypothetical protein
VIVGEKLFKDTSTGEIYVRIISYIVVRGLGGYGFKGSMNSVLGEADKPKRQPDYTAEELIPAG